MRRVSLDDLGAWVLKGNGGGSGIVEVAARGEAVRRWCVQPSYRTALMAAGQPVLFWVSGDRRFNPGVWATGRLTGVPEHDAGKLRVPLELVWLAEDRRLARDVLRGDERLAGVEVLRQPQAANPSFVTKAQFQVLRELWSGAG